MTDPHADEPLVLVVEDYQDAREMYSAYLQFSGYRVGKPPMASKRSRKHSN